MTACGRISQLEVHQLLISGLQVAYPIWLNGCEKPIITSLPESLANGISLTGGKSVYLEIDIPQSMAEEPDWKVLPIGKCSTIIIASLHKTIPLKSEGEVSMTMEVKSLLSQVMLDTSGHGSGNSIPRRPNLVVILTPPPHKLKELPKLVDTSSQVSTIDDVEMVEASLEGVPTTISPIAMTTRSRSITPPTDVAELWEKANKALEELLATKSSIDVCRWRAIWELSMELRWNESETAESIKETRAICSHATMDAEALCFSSVKEAKVTCIQTIKEAKATHTCTTWEAKTTCSAWPSGIPRPRGPLRPSHSTGNMPKPPETWRNKSSEEEGRSQTDFLSACQAALHASPAGAAKACW